MKYFSILIIAFLMFSCSGTKKAIEPTKEVAIIKGIPNVVEAPSSPKTPPTPKSRKQDNSIKISLGENGTISDDGITVTTEIIYTEAFDHSIFNDLLKKNVSTDGNVNYNGLKNDKTLQSYIELLKTYQPSDSWTKNDKLAYWINAYNAFTVKLIIDNYPIKSIKDVVKPWDKKFISIGDNLISLNHIEHKILRKMNEPRIHFAIVCASISCPKLQSTAFTASNLEEQLTNATKEFLADPTRNNLSKSSIKISKIFKWFAKDFKQNGSLIDFLNTYSEITISRKAKKSFMDYDWNLNE